MRNKGLTPLRVRRAAIAALWIIGATVPLLASVVLIFGCCVLPFHAAIHRVIPLCSLAVNFIRGEERTSNDQLPARTKQEPVKRFATELPRTFHLAVTPAAQHRVATNNATTYRSFITLGAVRCDRDVGLHTLLVTFLI